VKVNDGGWGLDRRISLALVLAIALETAGALIWAGAAAERIDQLELHAGQSGQANERLARLEAQVTAMRAQLDRIEARLDQR
jgi:hypothetical protein